MRASEILNETMTLDEKLEAIDAALKELQDMADKEARAKGETAAPIDPQDLLMCEGCQ